MGELWRKGRKRLEIGVAAVWLIFPLMRPLVLRGVGGWLGGAVVLGASGVGRDKVGEWWG